MSQILIQKQEQKLWQILDDCIKTNKYQQALWEFSDGKNKRCIIGVLLAYKGWDGNHLDTITQVRSLLMSKYPDMVDYKWNFKELTKEGYIANLKDTYKESGKINALALQLLNDNCSNPTTFKEFRDIFKEMGV